MQAGRVRADLASQVAALDPFDEKGRTALKLAARARTPIMVRDMISFFRPGVGPRPGSIGSANVSNVVANLRGNVLRVVGGALPETLLAIDAGRIALSSSPGRTALVVGFGNAGAFGLGALGALGGSALLPGPGTVAGGLGGAAAGRVGGEAFGGFVADFFFP